MNEIEPPSNVLQSIPSPPSMTRTETVDSNAFSAPPPSGEELTSIKVDASSNGDEVLLDVVQKKLDSEPKNTKNPSVDENCPGVQASPSQPAKETDDDDESSSSSSSSGSSSSSSSSCSNNNSTKKSTSNPQTSSLPDSPSPITNAADEMISPKVLATLNRIKITPQMSQKAKVQLELERKSPKSASPVGISLWDVLNRNQTGIDVTKDDNKNDIGNKDSLDAGMKSALMDLAAKGKLKVADGDGADDRSLDSFEAALMNIVKEGSEPKSSTKPELGKDDNDDNKSACSFDSDTKAALMDIVKASFVTPQPAKPKLDFLQASKTLSPSFNKASKVKGAKTTTKSIKKGKKKKAGDAATTKKKRSKGTSTICNSKQEGANVSQKSIDSEDDKFLAVSWTRRPQSIKLDSNPGSKMATPNPLAKRKMKKSSSTKVTKSTPKSRTKTKTKKKTKSSTGTKKTKEGDEDTPPLSDSSKGKKIDAAAKVGESTSYSNIDGGGGTTSALNSKPKSTWIDLARKIFNAPKSTKPKMDAKQDVYGKPSKKGSPKPKIENAVSMKGTSASDKAADSGPSRPRPKKAKSMKETLANSKKTEGSGVSRPAPKKSKSMKETRANVKNRTESGVSRPTPKKARPMKERPKRLTPKSPKKVNSVMHKKKGNEGASIPPSSPEKAENE